MKYEIMNCIRVSLGEIGRDNGEVYILAQYEPGEKENNYMINLWIGDQAYGVLEYVVGLQFPINENMKTEEWVYEIVKHYYEIKYYDIFIEGIYETLDYLEERRCEEMR